MPEKNTDPIKRSYSLSQLAENLAAQVQKTYSAKYWIRAEIGKLNHYPQSGHAYPQLLEKKNGAIVADLRGFIAKHTFQAINKSFIEVNGKPLDDGMQVLILCRLNYHPVYGLSLQISDIEPSYTLGEMARMRQEAIKRLKAAQLFSQNQNKHLPLLVQRLAVVSVETSKGYHDFGEVIAQSKYAECIEQKLFPALLQGDAAVGSIIKALANIEQEAKEFDAVAIIRGGGGETGLDCYDQYALAESVCKFPIPILTGIGHATNNTVVEQVAHQSFLTPTHLAQDLIQRFETFEKRVDVASNRLNQLTTFRIGQENSDLNEIMSHLEQMVLRKSFTARNHLNDIATTLAQSSSSHIQHEKFALATVFPTRISSATKERLSEQGRKIEQAETILSSTTIQNLEKHKNRINLFSEKVRILNPENTLKRGFTITKAEGKLVQSAKDVKSGDSLTTTFWDGEAISTVKETKHG